MLPTATLQTWNTVIDSKLLQKGETARRATLPGARTQLVSDNAQVTCFSLSLPNELQPAPYPIPVHP